ncbi:MAG TPA: Bax inhibitor-1/YccA family protein [Acidimicrobiia bacterium]
MTTASAPNPALRSRNPALNSRVFGSVSGTVEETMTVSGTAAKAMLYLVVLLGAATWGWNQVTPLPGGAVRWPSWVIWVSLGAFGAAMVATFVPRIAPLMGAVYSGLQGAAMGAISAIYEIAWEGIVKQAVLVTLGVMLVTLVAYATGLVKVGPRFRTGVIIATAGIALVYLVGWLWSLFTGGVPFYAQSTSIGIWFSVLVVGLAAFNLLLDFDLIARRSQEGAPKRLEWYAAFGLMVTLVWLYLEVLRLLALTRGRR